MGNFTDHIDILIRSKCIMGYVLKIRQSQLWYAANRGSRPLSYVIHNEWVWFMPAAPHWQVVLADLQAFDIFFTRVDSRDV